jgi:hypothetical protein
MIYTVKKHDKLWVLFRVEGDKLLHIATYSKPSEAKLAARLLAGWRGKVI